jgi:hypothetical protein
MKAHAFARETNKELAKSEIPYYRYSLSQELAQTGWSTLQAKRSLDRLMEIAAAARAVC